MGCLPKCLIRPSLTSLPFERVVNSIPIPAFLAVIRTARCCATSILSTLSPALITQQETPLKSPLRIPFSTGVGRLVRE